jgi:hypothetical protein
MKTPHKHAELIKAWADGAMIEKRFGNEWHEHEWCDIWAHDFEYRIKPEPKPDIVRYAFISTRSCDAVTEKQYYLDNIKLTFDGETGKLKSVEVIQ